MKAKTKPTGVTAIYPRVSSIHQKLDSQLPDLEARQKIYEAQGVRCALHSDKFTGKTQRRPGWDRIWAGVLSGEIDRIVIWRLDRLGRSLKELAALFEQLEQRGVELVSIRDGFDLSTIGGKLLAHILASVAEFETELRRERQSAGIAAAKAAGKSVGGSKPGRLMANGKPKPGAASKEAVKQVLALDHAGEKRARIARATGLSRATVYRVLREHGRPTDRAHP